MQNEEAKEALKNEALDANETNLVKEATVPNSTTPQSTRNNSRSPSLSFPGERELLRVL